MQSHEEKPNGSSRENKALRFIFSAVMFVCLFLVAGKARASGNARLSNLPKAGQVLDQEIQESHVTWGNRRERGQRKRRAYTSYIGTAASRHGQCITEHCSNEEAESPRPPVSSQAKKKAAYILAAA